MLEIQSPQQLIGMKMSTHESRQKATIARGAGAGGAKILALHSGSA
jgi:hypothetical protein